MLGDHYATVRRWAPAFLATFSFQGVPAAASLLRAVDILRKMNEAAAPKLPKSAATGFIRERWARYVMPGGVLDRRYYELCVLSELRGRLRAGDVWVVGAVDTAPSKSASSRARFCRSCSRAAPCRSQWMPISSVLSRAAASFSYPSAGGRLFGIGGMIEGWGFRFRRVMGSVHKLDYGHKFAGSASAPVVARGAEAGDCFGLLEPGSWVSVVARRYHVNANRVFAWRKRYREPVSTSAPLQLVPVTVTPDRQCEPSPASTSGLIEIELAGGCRVRVGNGVGAPALRLVLDVLERR